MADFPCLACEEQEYQGEDSRVPTPSHLCDFHEENGVQSKRTQERSVIDINTREPPTEVASTQDVLMECIEKVNKANTPLRIGLALKEMKERLDLSSLELSRHFGKTDMWAYPYLNLAKLSPDVQRLVEKGDISLGIGKEVGRAVPLEQQMTVVQKVRNMSAVKAKKFIKTWLSQQEGVSERRASRESENKVPVSPKPTIVSADKPERLSGAAEDFLKILGNADRSLSLLLDIPYSTLRNAFSDPMDLAMAKRHLLTSAYRLNEVLALLEAIEKVRR